MTRVQQRDHLFEAQWRPECVICKESVKLEESKANEYGQAIHEECYVSQFFGVLRFTAGTGSARGLYVIRYPITLTPRRRKECL